MPAAIGGEAGVAPDVSGTGVGQTGEGQRKAESPLGNDAPAAKRINPDNSGFGEASSHQMLDSKPSSPFHYSTTAPIHEVSPASLPAVAAKFTDSVGNFDPGAEHVEGSPPLDELPEWLWIKRITSAKLLGDTMGRHVDDPGLATPSRQTFSYQLNDTPVAMMQTHDTPDNTNVNFLATHPAVSGGGETMIEKAVNESVAAGHEGRVSLTATDDSIGFYEKLGFTSSFSFATGWNSMNLDPSTSDLWKNEGGVWSLNKNIEKKFLTGDDRQADSGLQQEAERATAPST